MSNFPISSLTRRRLLELSAGAILATGLVGRPAFANGGKINFWKMPNMGAGDENAYWDGFDKAFSASSGVDVDHLLLPWADFIVKYTAAFSSNTGPDVSYQVIDSIAQFAANGLFVGLQDIDPTLDTSNLNQAMVAAATHDGKLYGMPYIASRFALGLNEAVWEKAGKPDLPTTYLEIEEFAKKLTFDNAGKRPGEDGFNSSNIAVYGFGWPGDYDQEINYIYNYFFSYGVKPFSDDLKDIGFDNKNGRALLEHLRRLQVAGTATPLTLYSDTEKWAELLASGRAGLQWVQATTQVFDKFPDARLRVIPVPAGPAGAFTTGDAGFLSIAASSENKKAALDFIKAALSGEQYDRYLEATLLFPVTKNPDAKAVFGGVRDKREFDFLAASLEQGETMRFPQTLPYNGNQYLVGEINNYVAGLKSLDQMIADARQQVGTMAANAGL